jgi:hypothetical protein
MSLTRVNNCLGPCFPMSKTMGSVILQEEQAGEEADSERER